MKQSPNRKPHRSPRRSPPLPSPLKRPPRTDLSIRVDELDERTFPAVLSVAERLRREIENRTSLDEIRLLNTRADLVMALSDTHRSIRRLVSSQDAGRELAVDALPLVRVQMERCFLALLLEDNPKRWHTRYRKNAWRAFAEKFFRDRKLLGDLDGYREYFAPDAPAVRVLREFAREMSVAEDELQTLRIQATGDESDPRWEKRFIANMPTPGRSIDLLEDPCRKKIAALLYPYYDNLSHFSHSGLIGIAEAAILRDRSNPVTGEHRERYFRSNVLENTLPVSYVCSMLVATLLACSLDGDTDDLRKKILNAWVPYHCDGSPLGVALWDEWASTALDGADA